MSDARWFEIESDADAACRYFARAAALYVARDLDGDDEATFLARMAFMHTMQSAHTSMEKALLRVIDLLGEERPSGEHWHADLIRRVSVPFPSRPAIVPPELAKAALETRKFRHRAMHAYEDFSHAHAQPAADAAGVLAVGLALALAVFRRAVDP